MYCYYHLKHQALNSFCYPLTSERRLTEYNNNTNINQENNPNTITSYQIEIDNLIHRIRENNKIKGNIISTLKIQKENELKHLREKSQLFTKKKEDNLQRKFINSHTRQVSTIDKTKSINIPPSHELSKSKMLSSIDLSESEYRICNTEQNDNNTNKGYNFLDRDKYEHLKTSYASKKHKSVFGKYLTILYNQRQYI